MATYKPLKQPPANALTVAQVLSRIEEFWTASIFRHKETDTLMTCDRDFEIEIRAALKDAGMRLVVQVRMDTTSHFWVVEATK